MFTAVVRSKYRSPNDCPQNPAGAGLELNPPGGRLAAIIGVHNLLARVVTYWIIRDGHIGDDRVV